MGQRALVERPAGWFAPVILHHRLHSTQKGTRLLAVLLIGALLVSACRIDSEDTARANRDDSPVVADPSDSADGPDPGSVALTAADLPDACSLLGDDDLVTLVGPDPAAEADSGSMFGFRAGHPYTECQWDRSDEADGLRAVGVTIIAGDVFANFEHELYEAEPVEGLGERALMIGSFARATGGGTGTSMIVDQGLVTVIVGASGSVSFSLGDEEVTHDDAPDLPALTQIVLDRLEL